MSGFVYFLGCNWGQTGHIRVKIGYTRYHPETRRDALQPGSPELLDVLCYVRGDIALERKLHETFANCRLHNEWFAPFGLMDRFVRRLMCDGNGARRPTDYEVFIRAFKEEVFDWTPDPNSQEDILLMDTSADTWMWAAECLAVPE